MNYCDPQYTSREVTQTLVCDCRALVAMETWTSQSTRTGVLQPCPKSALSILLDLLVAVDSALRSSVLILEDNIQ